MKGRFLSLATAGLLSAMALSLDATQTPAQAACVTGVASWDVLWMRAGPSVHYRRVGSIGPNACGVRVYWNSCVRGGRWCRVRYRGMRGWVNMRYIDAGGVAPSRGCVVGVASWDVLWVRAGPSVRYRRVGSLPPGYCGITVSDHCRGNWCYIYANSGAQGWVNMRYIALR